MTFQVLYGGGGGSYGTVLDDVSVMPAAPMSTPEPGSVALLATFVLTGAGFLARRRKNARKAA